MSGADQREPFEYQGRLVFNSIQFSDVNGGSPEELRDRLLDELPSFSTGKPANEGDGYSSLDLSDYVEQTDLFDNNLAKIAKEIIDLEYKYETYPTEAVEVVDTDGTEIAAFPRSIKSAYVYWDYPDHLFIQGSKTKAGEVTPKVNTAFGEDVDLNSVEFDSEFLLWLYYKHYYGQSIPGDISIDGLTCAEVEGDLPDFGRSNRVDNCRNISQSIPVIAAVLQDMRFSMIEGNFLIDDYTIDVELHTEGRAQVKAQMDLQDMSKLNRILVTLRFLSELSELYQNWGSFDAGEKYPHPEFFADLRQEAVDQNAEFNFDFDGLVRHYADLRGENLGNYEFDFQDEQRDENG